MNGGAAKGSSILMGLGQNSPKDSAGGVALAGVRRQAETNAERVQQGWKAHCADPGPFVEW